jgi:hypothetical protein
MNEFLHRNFLYTKVHGVLAQMNICLHKRVDYINSIIFHFSAQTAIDERHTVPNLIYCIMSSLVRKTLCLKHRRCRRNIRRDGDDDVVDAVDAVDAADAADTADAVNADDAVGAVDVVDVVNAEVVDEENIRAKEIFICKRKVEDAFDFGHHLYYFGEHKPCKKWLGI